MPELPDLLFIKKYLDRAVRARTIQSVTVKQPVVLRNSFDRPLDDVLSGRIIQEIEVHGPFIRFGLSGSVEVILNLMLGGRLQHQAPGEKALGHLCLALGLDDGSALNVCDEQMMAKAYVLRTGEEAMVPKYTAQGIDVLSPLFTREVFHALARRHSRKQVRVFIHDQTAVSAIGNAYADEVLFEARIHPKTFVSRLSDEEIGRLYGAILSVMAWGREHVETAAQPIHVKVRDHMKVRNRKGEPCPRCGITIRREGVRGHDVFFCPRCQPPSRRLFIDWRTHGSGDDTGKQ